MSYVTTICRDCVFAEWALGIDAHEQVGCKLGRLEKFQKLDKVQLNDEGSPYFYEINGYCSACRNQGWIEHKNIKEPEKAIIQELEEGTTFDVLVNLTSSDIHVINDIISSINRMQGQVRHVHVIAKVSEKMPISLYHEFAKLKWPRSVEILVPEIHQEFGLWNWLNKSPAWGTIVVDNNALVPDWIIPATQKWVHQDLERISIIRGNHWYLVQNGILKLGMMNQLVNETIAESIEKMAKEQKLEHTIKDLRKSNG